MRYLQIFELNEFKKNVLTLMTGTAIAQAVPIAISPILTRLYTPEDFGILALYISIAGLFTVIATANYEASIMLPKKNSDAAHIVILSIAIALGVSMALFFIILIFNQQITHVLQNDAIGPWLYFIPLSTLLTGLYQTLSYWSNRNKQYRQLAISRVIQSIITGSTKLSLGVSLFKHTGLITGTLLGQSTATLYLSALIIRHDHTLFRKISKARVVALARKYSNFLKYSTPGAFFQTISTNSISIIINILFNTSVVGLYYFADTIIRAPLNLIFSSLAQVFHQHAVEIYNRDPKELFSYTKSIQFKMLLFLLPFILIMALFAPSIFEIIFGEKWRIAGEYLQYFLPLVFFNSLYAPISSLVDILGKQKFEMLWKISFFTSQVLSLYVSSLFFDFKYSILIMSLFGSFHYLYIDYYLKRTMWSYHE